MTGFQNDTSRLSSKNATIIVGSYSEQPQGAIAGYIALAIFATCFISIIIFLADLRLRQQCLNKANEPLSADVVNNAAPTINQTTNETGLAVYGMALPSEALQREHHVRGSPPTAPRRTPPPPPPPPLRLNPTGVQFRANLKRSQLHASRDVQLQALEAAAHNVKNPIPLIHGGTDNKMPPPMENSPQLDGSSIKLPIRVVDRSAIKVIGHSPLMPALPNKLQCAERPHLLVRPNPNPLRISPTQLVTPIPENNRIDALQSTETIKRAQNDVASVKSSDVSGAMSPSAMQAKTLPTAQSTGLISQEPAAQPRYMAFLSHNWGNLLSNGNYDNHERVVRIGEALKLMGLNIWLDSERMTGNTVKQMSEGIENSECVVVFITKKYIEKVAGSDAGDNCQKEFIYADMKKTAAKMLAVVLEPGCLAARDWTGPVGFSLGSSMYVDFSTDDGFENKIKKISDEISKRIGGGFVSLKGDAVVERVESGSKSNLAITRQEKRRSL